MIILSTSIMPSFTIRIFHILHAISTHRSLQKSKHHPKLAPFKLYILLLSFHLILPFLHSALVIFTLLVIFPASIFSTCTNHLCNLSFTIPIISFFILQSILFLILLILLASQSKLQKTFFPQLTPSFNANLRFITMHIGIMNYIVHQTLPDL